MPIILVVFVSIALMLTTICVIVYIRGDRQQDLRRCPRCRYDLTQTPGMTCPECGYSATDERQLNFTRRNRRFIGYAAIWAIAAVAAVLANPRMRDRIVAGLPRPVLAWTLNALVPAPPTAANADIPTAPLTPSALPPRARSTWSRLAWNQQYVHAMRAWYALVVTDDPKILADLPRMHAALAEMTAWDTAAGQTAWVDAWVQMDVLDAQRQRIESLPGRLVTLTLADGTSVKLDRNELFMLAFQSPRSQTEGIGLKGGPYIDAPQEYLSAMATTCGPAAQQYALLRLAAEPNGAVDIDALLATVEASAPTTAAQNVATDLRRWRTSFSHLLVRKPVQGR